jgi:hypothetical protein
MDKTYTYIAGPYRASNGGHDYQSYYDIDQHINEARMWATRLANEGIPFFCPHLNSTHMEVIAPNVPPEYWYKLDMLILEHASALLLIPGWRDSKGALAERDRARELGITCYTTSIFAMLVQDWGSEYVVKELAGVSLH